MRLSTLNNKRYLLLKNFIKEFLKTFYIDKRSKSINYQIPISQIRLSIEKLGIKKGDVLLVHSSIRNFFYGSLSKTSPEHSNIIDYSKAVIEMLIDLLGNEGTLIFPTDSISTNLARWSLKKKTFNYKRMPSIRGWLSEVFRQRKDVTRSTHPMYNLTAWGKKAQEIIEKNKLSQPYTMDKKSPWYKFTQLNGKILLLGVTHDSNSCIHLPEYLYPEKFPICLYMQKPYPIKYIDYKGREQTINLMMHNVPYESDSVEKFMKPLEKKYKISLSNEINGIPIKLVKSKKLLEVLVNQMKKGYCWQLSYITGEFPK